MSGYVHGNETTYSKVNYTGHSIHDDEDVGISQFNKTVVKTHREQKHQQLWGK